MANSENLTRRHFLAATGCTLATSSMANSAEASRDALKPEDLLERLQKCLGGPWPDAYPLRPKLRDTFRRDDVRIESVTYEAEPGERVPALLLIPENANADRPAPGIAVWHQHNGEWHLGKSEPAGLAGDPMHHTGMALAKLGYVVLCPDALCFEERQDSNLKDDAFERFAFLRYVVSGKSLAWKNILDMRRAIDYLASRAEVQEDKLGCYGHSMGSTHTWLLGPWETRLKALVGNCCLPTYAGIHRTKILHCFPNFVPGILQFGDIPDIAALTAPRPLHLNLGEMDFESPIEETRAGCERITAAYAAQNSAQNFRFFIEPGAGHVLSDAMWQQTKDWFQSHLMTSS